MKASNILGWAFVIAGLVLLGYVIKTFLLR